MYTYTYIYIYVYIYTYTYTYTYYHYYHHYCYYYDVTKLPPAPCTANRRTKTLDFRGFDPGRILILRGGILMSIGNLPEMLSQRILVGIILVGRLGIPCPFRLPSWKRVCPISDGRV